MDGFFGYLVGVILSILTSILGNEVTRKLHRDEQSKTLIRTRTIRTEVVTTTTVTDVITIK